MRQHDERQQLHCVRSQQVLAKKNSLDMNPFDEELPDGDQFKVTIN